MTVTQFPLSSETTPYEPAKLLELRNWLERKFNAVDLIAYPALPLTARQYLQTCNPNGFEYLVDMKDRFLKGKKLSDGQLAGVLNCAVAEFRKLQAPPSASTPVAPKAPEQDPTGDFFIPAVSVNPGPAAGEVQVHSGTYTVVDPKRGTHRTIRLRPADPLFFTNLPTGTRVAQYLSGSDNTSSFTGFAFVYADGTSKIWSKAANLPDKIAALYYVLRNSAKAPEMGLVYALASGRCYNCGRKLTVPASIHAGLGPDCAQQLGAAYGSTPTTPEAVTFVPNPTPPTTFPINLAGTPLPTPQVEEPTTHWGSCPSCNGSGFLPTGLGQLVPCRRAAGKVVWTTLDPEFAEVS